MALTKQVIVGAALAILDDYGLADLTMRRVADSLGVQAGALYYHVPNKQSLLAAVADHILAERPAVSTPGDPGETLRLWGRGLRSVLLTHRDAAELVASTQVLGLGEVDPCLEGREALIAAGLPQPDATMAALLHFILGHVTGEQTRLQLAQLSVATAPDEAASERDFEWGLGLMIRGICGR